MKTIELSILVLAALLTASCQNTMQSSQHATKYNPKAAEYNIKLGLAYLQQGETERAKRKLLTALAQSPHSSDANGAMAYFLEVSGDIEPAKKYYLRAIKYGSQKGAANNNYGAFLCRRKAFLQAERYFLAAATDHNYVNTADAYENAGLCATQIPDKTMAMAKAKKYFKKALERSPKRENSIIELAEIACKERQFALAKKYLMRFEALGKKSAQSVWLHYRIVRKTSKRQAAKYAAILKKSFSESREYQLFKSGVL